MLATTWCGLSVPWRATDVSTCRVRGPVRRSATAVRASMTRVRPLISFGDRNARRGVESGEPLGEVRVDDPAGRQALEGDAVRERRQGAIDGGKIEPVRLRFDDDEALGKLDHSEHP